MGRPRKDGRVPVAFIHDSSGRRLARVRRILGDEVPNRAQADSLLRGMKEPLPTPAEAMAYRVSHAAHEDEMFGYLPKGAMSQLLDAVERLQAALGLVAFLRPRKTRALYLAEICRRLKPLLRAAPMLPKTLADVPPVVAALQTYLSLQQGALARKLQHIDYEKHGVVALREQLGRDKGSVHLKITDAELLAVVRAKRVSSNVAAAVAVRTHGLSQAPSTFKRTVVEAKYPGWPAKTRSRKRR